jgi:hypothetical protein
MEANSRAFSLNQGGFRMKYQMLFTAALVMLTITACGTTVPAVTDQTQSDVSLEASRVRTPPPPKPVSLAFRTYTVTVVRNGLTLRGFLNITNEAVPNQPGALRATYTVPKASYLESFPASAAVVAAWVPFESLPGIFETAIYYGLPSIITLGTNNSISLKTGNPDPNSLNQGQVVLNLAGQLVKPAPTVVGGFANPDIVGNPAAPGTTPVSAWSGLCAVSLGFCK